MGICMDTGRNGAINGQETKLNPATFGSWPIQSNGSKHYQRVQQKSRTMSEPIMVVSANSNGENTTVIESSSLGPGPPIRIPLTLQRKTSPIESDNPDIPVIFVLGGPGSGKITHCEHLAVIDDRILHLNMQAAFLEIASEISSADPNIVPAYKALEVLIEKMSDMKNREAFVISGYPRNMRDVVEYMARVQRADGVILLDWSDRSLERQIQLGTQMKEIDINLARYEMNNYRSNIIPVAQFFDQQGHLHIVAGQRPPDDVFEDFAEEIHGILSHTIGVRREQRSVSVPQQEIEIERPQSVIKEESPGPDETKVVIHTSPENSVKRKPSIDSVDLMIEEEIKHIIDDPDIANTTEERVQTPKKDIEIEDVA